MITPNQLVEAHLQFAQKISNIKRRSLPRRISTEEIQAAAYMGLVEAANRFDSSKGVAFTTYAYPRIAGAIIDYLRECGYLMTSLDSCLEDGTTLATRIAAPCVKDAEELFEEVTSNLDEKAQQVLRCYYLDNMSMKEVGYQYGVTESRVSQLISNYRKEIAATHDYMELCDTLAA
jgi:RNA polymerase sigma factor for flagellar operon FliA